MSLVQRYTPKRIKDKAYEYYYKVRSGEEHKELFSNELKRRDKILKYIHKYEELQDKIKRAEDSYKKAVDARERDEQRNEKDRNNLYKRTEELKKEEVILENRATEFYYLAIAGLIVSLAFILLFAYDAYEGIKNSFKEFFNFNNSLGDRLLFALKGVGWCSLILLPIAITIYFYLEYLNYKRQANDMSRAVSDVNKRIEASYTRLGNNNNYVGDYIKTLNNLRHELDELINNNESLYII